MTQLSASLAAKVLNELRAELGESVSEADADLASARADKSGKISSGTPLCVVFAKSTEQVSSALRIANRHSIPVVARGGGSGLAGGAVGSPGEIVLSLEAMNRIIEISPSDRWAVVEAGVINQDLNLAAQLQGLWFAPDPASRQWSTIGGNIATNAGGLLCVKYGVTREAVLELTVVLADGEIMRVGHKTVKGVTGFDLASLFVGSEGTLGVITEARVALRPIDPNPIWTISGIAQDIQLATHAVQETIRLGHQPSILELLDERSSGHIARHLGRTDLPEGVVHLIAQTDGAAAESIAAEIGLLWKSCGLQIEVATGRDDLIQFRKAFHPALEKLGSVLIEDVAVPRSQLGHMFAEIRRIEAEFDLEIPTVAHAGDGNLHPNFVYQGDEIPEKVWLAADALFRSAVALGGTLTGEHGVGMLKSRWLKDELGEAQWQLQLKIKQLFDPKGILNPGKVFASSSSQGEVAANAHQSS